MTVGAAASLTCTLNTVTNPGDEVIVVARTFRSIACGLRRPAARVLRRLPMKTRSS